MAACSAALITLLLAGFVSSLQSLNRRANKLATVQTKALNEIREQYELAVKGSHDGIWDWNIPAQSVYYSPRWKEIFGYAENELSNSYETWHSLIHPDDVERNQTKMNDYFEGRRETYHFEGRFRHKNGEYLWCLVRGEAIRDADGKPVRMAGSLTDITGRKNAELQILAARETAEAATKAKSEFLANMSHEIRTPLTGLLGTANLLRSTPLNADQLDYLEVIHQSADSLLVIINDILDFSKIEANKVTLEEIEFNLNDLTSDVTKMLSYSAAQKGLEFETAFPERLHNHVIGDPARIRQVLLNLISNAIKFTAKGTVRFQVRLLREFDGMARLRFEVTDTGIGMNEEALTAVFGAFSQADTSTTRKYGGTGLGLSICKRLVQLMNSDIQAWSRPNHGSRFWFDLDLPFGSALNDSSDLNESERTEITAGARILVAEDNQINQRVLMEVLRQAGYKPYGASNGLEALERMSSGEVDLVLMDCQMPELDGFEATERWRASIYPAASELPILALTANATKAVRERALASGMNDYLSKPIRPEILVRSIERWLSGRVNAPRVKLDERKLKELSDPARLGSPELLREVVNMFLEQAPMQMIRIVNASAVGDWDTMAKSAHPMKSASGSLGLHALQELFGKIEAWPRGKSEGLDPLIQETAEALREAREWLTSRLQAS